MGGIGLDHHRGAAIAGVAGLEREIALAIAGGQLYRLDGVLRVVQEQVGLQLAVADRIGLEGQNAAEHAALMRRQRVQAPVRADIEEHRVGPAPAQLFRRQPEQLGELRPLPLAGDEELPVDDVVAIEQELQAHALLDHEAVLEQPGIGHQEQTEYSPHDRNTCDSLGNIDHARS